MTTQTPPRRTRRGSRSAPFDARILLWILGVGLGAFLLGYLFIAIFVFRSSDRPPVASVPELRDLTVPQADARVSALGLELVVGDSLPNADVPEGSVLAQSPLPGREVLPGSRVRVIVSAGRERRTVLDVAGMRQEEATRILDALGFEVAVEEITAPEAAGRVISADPPVGSTVRVPSTIRLTVSSGPPMAAVPNVVGLLEHDARDALESVGFRVGGITREFRFSDIGVVVAQSPLPGDSLRQGGAVGLRVATDQLLGVEP